MPLKIQSIMISFLHGLLLSCFIRNHCDIYLLAPIPLLLYSHLFAHHIVRISRKKKGYVISYFSLI